MSIYPVLVRHDYHDYHDYTLRLSDSVDARLTVQQVLSLRDQIEQDQKPISDDNAGGLRTAVAEIRAQQAYPPNTLCVCGDLIHPDMPMVEVEADGGLFHWNAEGGGHRFDINPYGKGRL